MVSRSTAGRGAIRIALPFEVPRGEGAHEVDLAIAARLQLQIRLAPDSEPFAVGRGNLPASAISGLRRVETALYQVVNGAVDTSTNYGGFGSLDVALPPGDYLLRSSISTIIGRETLIHVPAGEVTRIDFDFGVAQIDVDARDRDGFPIARVRTELFDPRTGASFALGNSRINDQTWAFYLPPGAWEIETGREGGGNERTRMAVMIDRPGEQIVLRPQVGGRMDAMETAAVMAEDNPGCLAIDAALGCMIEIVTPERMQRTVGGAETLAPRFTGTWSHAGRLWSLVQEGRRVWGDVEINGAVGRFWGEVAADGLTLRGSMDHFASPRGAMELRLAPDGLSLSGRTHHSFNLADRVTARRISAARPELRVANGTEDDLRLTMTGALWPTADSAEFAAFMAPARLSAESDIDALQARAAPENFNGRWNTNHQTLHLHQEGRRVWGRRDNGTLEGEVSADGRVLRGIWDNGGRWGPFEFRLNPARDGFEGAWGERGTELGRGAWNGTRITWLVDELAEVLRRSDAQTPEFEAFFAPVRDPDPVIVPPLEQAALMAEPLTEGAGVASGEMADFAPIVRYDFTHAHDDRLAVSFVFGDDRPGEISSYYNPGFVWLVEGWCGEGCPSELLPLSGGASVDQVPNALERLIKGGVFPAVEQIAQGQAVFEVFEATDTEMGLLIRFISEPYREAGEAWRNSIVDNYGAYRGKSVRDFTLADWPPLPVQATVTTQDDPTPDVAIGAIVGLPAGIFATLDLPDQAWRMQGFAALDDPMQLGRMAMQCATSPVVVHPDGLIAERSFDMMRAMSGGSPFRTMAYALCAQSGPMVSCAAHDQPLDGPRGSPVFTYQGVVEAGPGSSFAISTENGTRLYRTCLLPEGFMSPDERGGDGRRIIEHMGAREDGRPGLDFDAAGQVILAGVQSPVQSQTQNTAPETSAALEYDRMTGTYFLPARGPAQTGCVANPVYLDEDGALTIWDFPSRDRFEVVATLSCDAAGVCTQTDDQSPYPIQLNRTTEGLSICREGRDCVDLAPCAAGLVPEFIQERLSSHQPGVVLPLDRVPAGIYLPDRWGRYSGETDPFELIDACSADPIVVYPDGLEEHMRWRSDLDPPRHDLVMVERCAPTGDSDWPLACEGQQHFENGETETYIYRKSLIETEEGDLRLGYRFDEPGKEADPLTYRFCVDGEGLGLALDISPVGAALFARIRGTRSDGGPGLTFD
jgi:hypothetical protein